jgi:hypothetical protein
MESGMTRICGFNPVRFIDLFVDGLDLKSARFELIKRTCASVERALC